MSIPSPLRAIGAGLLLLLTLPALTPAQEKPDVVFYVSPRGNDNNRGTRAKPFATLERARDAVRRVRSGPGGKDKTVTVRMREGRYILPRTFVLGPGDGGSPGHEVTYEPEKGENAFLSGGTDIPIWQKTGMNGMTVWKRPFPVGGTDLRDVHELWINGKLAPQSRFPRNGYLAVESVPGVTHRTEWQEGQTSFSAPVGALPKGEKFAGAEAVVMNRWVESRLPVTSFDPDSNLFRFGRRSMFRLEKGDLFYLVNVKCALAEPGDWYADRDSGAIYYIPKPTDGDPEGGGGGEEWVVPRLTTLLSIEGRPDSGKFVSHVTFRKIKFEYAGWYFPAGIDTSRILPGGFPQADFGVPAAVTARGAHSCTFEECRITDVGTYGFELGEGCKGNVISGCMLFDLGGGGIKIGETVIRESEDQRTSGNSIIDCHIYDGGKIFHSSVGIWIGQSGMNRLVQNTIHGFYYTGISIGWTWGYGPALAQGNLVSLNHVHHIGVRSDGDGPILSDMGGIYTLGNQEGTLIRYNVFHDIAALRYGGWGIYFDEGTTHITAERNMVYNTTHGGFHQHYGKENRFRDNILAYGRDLQVQRTRLENHTSFAFEHNIVLWDTSQFVGGNARGGSMIFDNNLYWFAGKDSLLFDSLSFAGWQSRGNDVHSRIADPGFENPGYRDFRFKYGSNAAALGYEELPFEDIRGDVPFVGISAERPEHSRHRILYNSDGSNIFWRKSFSRDNVYRSVDEVADAGITTFLFNPNPCQKGIYPGGKAGMFSYEFPVSPGYVPSERDSMYRHFSDNLQMLLKDSLDPVGMIVDRARLRGMEAFLTIRMNELHDVDVPGSPLLGDFWKSHSEYRLGGYEGWGAYALNYGIPAVREYYYSLIRELCERYPVDGIELDFMRFPYYFPRDSANSPSRAALMTQFVEQVRRMSREAGNRRGIPILLSARVPSSLASCAYAGLDPAEWSRRGLVDFLTVAPFLSTEPDMHIVEFRNSCGDIPLYGCLEFMCGERMMTVEEMRAASALFYAAGADGIYSFNYFCAREGGQEPVFSVFHDIKDPVRLGNMEKVYTLSAAKSPIPHVSLPAPLPLRIRKGETRRISLPTSEPVLPAGVRLRVECADTVAGGSIDLRFNGVLLRPGRHPATRLVALREVLYDPPPVAFSLEFDLDPNTLRNVNTISLSALTDVTVNWIYLTVNH
jgi:hypothetical protein